MKIGVGLVKRLNNQQEVTRDELQSVGQQLMEDYDSVWFRWCVSLGKTRMAGLVGNGKKVLCIVLRTVHLTGWKEDLEKHGFDYSKWTFTVCNSIHKYTENIYDIVVYDEVDTITENYLEHLNKIQRNKTVLLTGDANFEKQKLIKSISQYEWKIDYNKALAWKLVPKIKVNCIAVNLDNKNKYLTYKRFNKEFNVSEVEYLTEIEKDIKYWREKFNEDGSKWSKIKFLRLGLDRKKLYDLAKQRITKELFESHSHRTIVFVSSIEEANTYEHCIHSKKTENENQQVIEDFNQGLIHHFANVNCVVRGVNLVDLNFGIFQTFTSDGIFLYQSAQGRMARGLQPEVFIPYIRNTKNQTDLEKFIKTRQIEANWI